MCFLSNGNAGYYKSVRGMPKCSILNERLLVHMRIFFCLQVAQKTFKVMLSRDYFSVKRVQLGFMLMEDFGVNNYRELFVPERLFFISFCKKIT